MPLSLSPFDGRYTRHQLSEATGIDAEILGYWIKEDLIRALEGGGLGRGKHRLFGFEAIHIAALLKELGRYGVQTAGLKQVSQLLWGVVTACGDRPDITEEVRMDAAKLRRARANYCSSGTSDNDQPKKLHYSSFEDWLADHPNICTKAFEIESWFDEGANVAFGLYHDLFTERILDEFDSRWIFVHVNDELIAIPEDLHLDSVDLERVTSYLTINISRVIKPIWML